MHAPVNTHADLTELRDAIAREQLYRATRCTLCHGPLWLPAGFPGPAGNFVSPDGITHNACVELAKAHAAAGFPR